MKMGEIKESNQNYKKNLSEKKVKFHLKILDACVNICSDLYKFQITSKNTNKSKTIKLDKVNRKYVAKCDSIFPLF